MSLHPELERRLRNELTTWAGEAPVGGEREFAAPSERVRGRAPLLVVAAAIVVLVVVLAVVVRRDGPPAVVEQPPLEGRVTIPIGDSPGVRGVAVGPDAVWAQSSRDSEVYRVDPERDRVVRTFDVPDHLEGLTTGEGYVWLGGYDPDQVVRLDPTSGEVETVSTFASQPSVLVAFGVLWVLADGAMSAFDPVTLQQTGTWPIDGTTGFLAAGEDVLWFTRLGEGGVARFDPSTGTVDGEVSFGADQVRAIAVAEDGAPWVTLTSPDQPRGQVVRIDPERLEGTDPVWVGRAPHAVALQGDTLWVTNRLDGTLSAVDVTSAELRWTTPIGATPGGVATGFGSVWVTPHRQQLLVRLDPAVDQPHSPDPSLEQVVNDYYLRCSGTGEPTVVLEPDLQEGAGSWAFVEQAVARRTRVCTTDRPGLDDSDAAPLPPARTLAQRLHAVLAAAGEADAPMILVGDGLGAHTAQLYAHTYPDDVVGLVLVDALPPGYLEQAQVELDTEAPWLAGTRESLEQVEAAGDLGDLPLVVVALDARAEQRGDQHRATILRELRAQQADLSTDGRLVIAPAGLGIAPMAVPAVVVDAIESLLVD